MSLQKDTRDYFIKQVQLTKFKAKLRKKIFDSRTEPTLHIAQNVLCFVI